MGHPEMIWPRVFQFELDVGNKASSFHSWLIKEIRRGAVHITRWEVAMWGGIEVTAALFDLV